MNNLRIKRSFKNIAYSIYILFIEVLRVVQIYSTPRISCSLQNIISFIRKSPSRFSFSYEHKFYSVNDTGLKRFFPVMSRGFDLYVKGIWFRGEQIFNSYCLYHVKFEECDIVVDCGANFGDLFIKLGEQIREENYITFEPSSEEHLCLKLNYPKGQHFNLGLSSVSGKKTFYLCSETGDSSLVQPKFYSEKYEIELTTLDEMKERLGIEKCKLLKLEAEGWEPEILSGSQNFLNFCEYVAIDGGPERGVSEAKTFHTICNILQDKGFTMLDCNGEAYRALFVNRRYSKQYKI